MGHTSLDHGEQAKEIVSFALEEMRFLIGEGCAHEIDMEMFEDYVWFRSHDAIGHTRAVAAICRLGLYEPGDRAVFRACMTTAEMMWCSMYVVSETNIASRIFYLECAGSPAVQALRDAKIIAFTRDHEMYEASFSQLDLELRDLILAAFELVEDDGLRSTLLVVNRRERLSSVFDKSLTLRSRALSSPDEATVDAARSYFLQLVDGMSFS